MKKWTSERSMRTKKRSSLRGTDAAALNWNREPSGTRENRTRPMVSRYLSHCCYLWLLTSLYITIHYHDLDWFTKELASVCPQNKVHPCLTNRINHRLSRGLNFFSTPFRIAQWFMRQHRARLVRYSPDKVSAREFFVRLSTKRRGTRPRRTLHVHL